MTKFNVGEIEILKFLFSQLAQGNLKPSSYNTYKTITDEYLDINILGKVDNDDYTNIFQLDLLRKINRKANTVRPALKLLLDSLEQEGVLKTKINYLTAKNNIEQAFPGKNEKEGKEAEFYTPQEIKTLFSGNLVFKTVEESKMLPLICSFSFFCMMKQGEIAKIEMSDVDIEKKRVRNIKTKGNKQTGLVEWINLEDVTYGYLIDYLQYRESLNVNAEKLMVTKNGAPLINKDFNRIFNTLKRVENQSLLNGKVIKQEVLITSMMLYILTSTNGQGINEIMLIHEPKNNKPFEYAFKEYLTSMREQYSRDSIDSFSMSDILPKQIKPPILQESLNDNETVLGVYSEEKKIKKMIFK